MNIVETFAADTSRLYGSLDEAIAYLKEVNERYAGTDISLEECWYGYDNMEMVFTYTREETAQERARRKALEREQEEARARDRAQRAEREEKLAAYNKLKKELGIR